jgi:phosphoketolase
MLTKFRALCKKRSYLQIYLLANPLLRTPLEAKHIKARLLGHWGTTRKHVLPTHQRY